MHSELYPVHASQAPKPPQRRSAKQRARRVLPKVLVELLDRLAFRLRGARIRAVHRLLGAVGLTVAKRADYYSPLPVLDDLRRNRGRWDRPSRLSGLNLDAAAMQRRLADFADRWEADYATCAGDYLDNAQAGFGPGFPRFDARTLYYLLREHQPGRYLEVGSGLSTYYASIAGDRNATEGRPMKITCIEPYPYPALTELPCVELVEQMVQDVPVSDFEQLDAGDVLFIDSSHVLRLDGDVPYLFLEVLPRLRPGVLVHVHDVPFPYNVPYPADTWVFGERWPVYWTEAMLVQAFLAFNSGFEVLLSTPLIRSADERFLTDRFADYVPVRGDPNPPSSLWLRRVA